MINISICLSDIPESARKKSEKNGKVYASFIVDERKEADQYGNTHSVSVSQSKEQREAKEAKVYVGGGKEFKFEKKEEQPTQQQEAQSSHPTDDLPF